MFKKFFLRLERESGRGYILPALAFTAFLESIIFPLPVDIFTIGLSTFQPKKWFSFATVGTLFSVLGALGAYYLGFYFFEEFGMKMINFYGYQEEFLTVKSMFDTHVFWVMFVSAFTPIPYKVFTLTGGMLKVALGPFIIASIIGRGLRFYLESYLAARYGRALAERIVRKINLYSVIFVILTILYIIFF